MATTILTTGLACIIAAIIGGGLKAFGIDIPIFESLKRQILLGGFGFFLMFLSIRMSPPDPPTEKIQSTPTPEVSPGSTISGKISNTPTPNLRTPTPDPRTLTSVPIAPTPDPRTLTPTPRIPTPVPKQTPKRLTVSGGVLQGAALV